MSKLYLPETSRKASKKTKRDLYPNAKFDVCIDEKGIANPANTREIAERIARQLKAIYDIEPVIRPR